MLQGKHGESRFLFHKEVMGPEAISDLPQFLFHKEVTGPEAISDLPQIISSWPNR